MRSKTVTTVIITVASIILLGLLIADMLSIKSKVIKCVDGEGTAIKFDDNDPYIITGDWEVYKDYLIVSEEKDINTLEKTYLSSLSKNLKKGNETKYYSYRVVIKGIPKGSILACSSNSFLKRYAVYYNRTLVRADGYLVTKDGTNITLDDYTQTYLLEDDELEIIVELANNSTSYYAFVQDFYLDGVAGHFSIFSFQSVYLIGVVICSLLSLYFALLCFSRRNPLRNILFVVLNLSTIGAILFNGQTTFLKIPPLPGTIEKLIKLFCYYGSTMIFTVLAKTDICQKKLGLQEFLLIGSCGIVVLASIIIPIQFTNYLYIFVCVLAIGALIYSTFQYLKHSAKDSTLQVTITFFLIETIMCYFYEIVLQCPVLTYQTSSLSTVFLLACIMLTVLNSYLREKEAEQSNLTKELTDKIRDTEFTFLNSQIQSHFIYNTLNSIQSLCNTNPEKASELVEEFSFYLRNRLEFNKMPNLINLEDEIDHIKTYINIEQTRFGDNIKCVYDLAITDIKIPPLSVQPLVENAVKHGISKQVGGGTIILSTYQDKKNVYIRVKDNGLGFDINTLKDSKRVGFNNIKDRLNLYLDATIKLESKIGVGTVVTITIPKKSLTYDKTNDKPL